MTILISIIIYIILVSWSSWLVNKPKKYKWISARDSRSRHHRSVYGVHKNINDVWEWSSDISKNGVASIPIDCLNDISKTRAYGVKSQKCKQRLSDLVNYESGPFKVANNPRTGVFTDKDGVSRPVTVLSEYEDDKGIHQTVKINNAITNIKIDGDLSCGYKIDKDN